MIDGTTQPGFIDSPIIELNGTNAGPSASGLRITAGGSTVKGLVINRFGGDGIVLQTLGGSESTSGSNSTGNSILSNLIYSNQNVQIQLQAPCPSADCTPPPPANNGQPAPILDSVTFDVDTGVLTIMGMVSGEPNTDYFLQFFLFQQCPSGMPSGTPQLLTTLPILQRTNISGSASFTIMLSLTTAPSGFVNATSTDPQNNTSPFSACAQINGGCTFSIVPTGLSFSPEGGMNGVSVLAQSGCNWSATSNNPDFITITSGSSGSGIGTVSCSVAANSSSTPRSGTITVAGLTFTVLQGARFSDVPEEHPFFNEIGKLSARGVTLGCDAGIYCPDLVVTRQQMAAFLVRAFGL